MQLIIPVFTVCGSILYAYETNYHLTITQLRKIERFEELFKKDTEDNKGLLTFIYKVARYQHDWRYKSRGSVLFTVYFKDEVIVRNPSGQ